MEIITLILAALSLILIIALYFKKPDQRLEFKLEQTQRDISDYLEKDNQRDRNQQEQFSVLKESITKDIYQFANQQAQQLLNFSEKLNKYQLDNTESLSRYNEALRDSITKNINMLSETIEKRLNLIDEKVANNLQQGFEKTNATFSNILERLSKIDEAQKKIDSLSNDIVSLQDILTDKKSRGTFGEVQLHQILSAVFGEKNDQIYQMQYQFSSNVRADAVLFTPEPLGTIAIDSKFPLENYRKMIDKKLDEGQRANAEKAFVFDCRKHIDTIAEKYIIPNVTSEQAFLFLPAEAIFAEINAYHPEILDYASRKKVWITSPTTLMSTLTTIQTILINIERSKYTQEIQKELAILQTEFSRYRIRWDALSKHIETVSSDVRDINTTTEKITKKFERISNVKELENHDEN